MIEVKLEIVCPNCKEIMNRKYDVSFIDENNNYDACDNCGNNITYDIELKVKPIRVRLEN